MDNRNQSAFQFSNPVMLETHFSIHRDFNADNMSDELETPIRVSFCRPNTEDFQDSSVFIQLTVEVGENDASFPYYVSMTMGADFRWDDSIPDEMISQMLSRNAPMLLLAYARPLVAQLTGASPVGPIHIPYMNFLQQNDDEK